jgi:hypothetical protein
MSSLVASGSAEKAKFPSRRLKVVLYEARTPGDVVYECDTEHEALAWAEEWLKDPLGLAVGIVAAEPSAEGGDA